MRVTRVGYALGIAAAVAVFAGCSSNGSSLNSVAPTHMGTQSIVSNHIPVVLPARLMNLYQPGHRYQGGNSGSTSPDVTTTFLYECSFNASVCRFYKKGHNVLSGTISSGLLNPQGIGTNPANGNIYIADTGNADVQVYGPGSTTLVQDIPVSGEFPVDAAVDTQGNVYVANIFSQAGNPGSVDVFNAAGTHLRNLTDPNVSEGISVSVDENHMLTFCFVNLSGFGECDNFAHARGHGVVAESGFGFAGGNSYDNAEHTVEIDQNASAALTFSSGSLCGSLTLNGSSDNVMMSMSRTNGFFVTGDAGLNALRQFAYTDCANGSENAQKAYTAGIGSSDLVIGAGVTPGVRP